MPLPPSSSRRRFLQATSAAALLYGFPRELLAAAVQSPFRVAVISDEISQDFDHACAVIANDFGLRWVELRGLWGKSLFKLDDGEINQAIAILEKYYLRVTDIASPLYKTDWPGAPVSKFSPKGNASGFTFQQQDEVLQKSIALARQFKTDRIRCFDFWRLDDQAPHRQAINSTLFDASHVVGKQNLILVLENEYECNTATGREAANTLAALQTPHLMLNWDPGNAVARGETDAYPAGFALIPKNRIGHCHVKCAVTKPAGGFEWAPVGKGLPDWTAQFRALRQAGYREAVSLETHWSGGGSPEASTRISWAGMKDALQQSGA